MMNDEIIDNLIGTVLFVEQQKDDLETRFTKLETRVSKLETTVFQPNYKGKWKTVPYRLEQQYKVTFDQLSNKIFINNKKLKALSPGDSKIYNFCEYINDKKNQKIPFQDIAKALQSKDMKINRIHNFIKDMGFDKDIKSFFFEIDTKNQTLLFRDEITSLSEELSQRFL